MSQHYIDLQATEVQ